MDTDNYLLIIKGKDRTQDVSKLEYTEDSVKVCFRGSTKVYTYHVSQVKLYKKPEILNINGIVSVAKKYNLKDIDNIKNIFKFSEYYKIYYTNDTTNVIFAPEAIGNLDVDNFNKTEGLKKVKNENCKDINSTKNPKDFKNAEERKVINCYNNVTGKLQYFKEIADMFGVVADGGKALLSKSLSYISFVNEETALNAYLNPPNTNINKDDKDNENNQNNENDIKTKVQMDLNNSTSISANNKIIYPFGSNLSQMSAVQNALNGGISVIEGPPGTGKTQTILNIISNIIATGKNVAVVSNNNSATDNIFEKLEKEGLGYICAKLGKADNKSKFIKAQEQLYPNIPNVNINEEEVMQEIEKTNANLAELYKLKNEHAICVKYLDDVKTEYKYFCKENDIEPFSKEYIKPSLNVEKLLSILIELESIKEASLPIPVALKIKYAIKENLLKYSFFKLPLNKMITLLQSVYYILEIEGICEKVASLKQKISTLTNNNPEEKLKELSWKYLRHTLYTKYGKKAFRPIFSVSNLFYQSDEFAKEYPVIFSTTYSIKKSLNPDFVYDYIIMDESSQIDLVTGVLALSCAKAAIIVGDRNQLPNVITDIDKARIQYINSKYNIEPCYNYNQKSFISSVTEAIPSVPQVLLREHYRCHPKIINFSNKKYYNDELIIFTEDKGEKNVLDVVITDDNANSKKHVNKSQINAITNKVVGELKKVVTEDEIGIVSPYNEQKKGLETALNGQNIEIDTVHKYQGRQKDAIVITTVDSQITDFVDNPRLLNVAITRAKKYLRLITSPEAIDKNSNVSDLIKYIKYNNFTMEQGKLKSIYELLYKAKRPQRLIYLKSKNEKKQADLENLIYDKIKALLTKNGCYDLDIAVHVNILDILQDLNILDKSQKNYLEKNNCMLDVVIYSKMDKKTVMVLDITNKVSKEVKVILSKYTLPVICLTDTNCDIENKMMDILSVQD